jgi:hypothetical protein
MDSAHPPSHPELLAWLARDFSAHPYDLRRLIRQLAGSKAYQLASRPPLSAGPPPLDSLFARALDKPLSAEVLARSLRTALEYPEAHDPGLRRHLAGVFPDLFADNFSPSVHQTLFLSNDPLIDQLIAGSPLVDRLKTIQSPQALVHEVFQVILARAPDAAESERATAFLTPGDSSSIEPFCWALLTAPEFRLNH